MADIQFTVDRPRHKPNFVIHDFPFQSGDPASPTDQSSATILPYGAYFTGNGAVNPALAHKDILFYWDCESTSINIPSSLTAVANGSIELSTDNAVTGSKSVKVNATHEWFSIPITDSHFDRTKGSLMFWAKSDVYSEKCIFITTSDGGYLRIANGTSAGNRVSVFWLQNSTASIVTVTHHIDLTFNQFNCVQITWEDTKLKIIVNGIVGTAIGTIATFTGTVNNLIVGDPFYAGNGTAYYDQIFITNNPDTPQSPTANGVPLHIPILDRS